MTEPQERGRPGLVAVGDDLGFADELLQRLLRGLAVVGVLGGLAMVLVRLGEGGRADLNVGINAGFAAISLAVLGLARIGRWHAAAHLLLWGGWLLATLFLAANGGARSINVLNYLVLIHASGWMLGRTATLLMTGASVLALLALVAGEAQGWLVPPPPRHLPLLTGLYLSICMGIAAAMAWLARGSYAGRLARERQVSTDLAAREAEARQLSQVVEQSPGGVLITDLSHRIDYANPAARQLLQAGEAGLTGQDARRLAGAALPEADLRALDEALAAGRVWQGELTGRRPNGTEFVETITVASLHEPGRGATHHVWSRRDITERRRAEAQLQYLSQHDRLTGLPNRRQFETRLGQALRQAAASGGQGAVVMLNVDRFKGVNEARGRQIGDLLLRALAQRLRLLAGAGRPLARLEADDFVILLPALEADAAAACGQALAFASTVHEAMVQPLVLPPADRVVLCASIGIALFQGEGDSPAEALRRAHATLNRAKSRGGAQTAFFEAAMGEAAQRRFAVERDLREALTQGQLRLFLQPQVDMAGRCVGAEALVRWQHPRQGLLQPAAFVPIAEESDLIVGLGRWVFTEAVRLMACEARGGRALALSVNLSPRQFRQADFVPWLGALLAEHRVPAGLLTLEVTESLMIDDLDAGIARMQALRALGVHFSIDDFGTGYSSLAYLKRLPVSELKIDKGFVQDAPRHADDAALVETILAVARHMRLKVVAEGVEDADQARFLAERDASVILQGYLYGKPAPAEEWLGRWRADGALPTLGDGDASPVPAIGAALAPELVQG